MNLSDYRKCNGITRSALVCPFAAACVRFRRPVNPSGQDYIVAPFSGDACGEYLPTNAALAEIEKRGAAA